MTPGRKDRALDRSYALFAGVVLLMASGALSPDAAEVALDGLFGLLSVYTAGNAGEWWARRGTKAPASDSP